MGFVFGDSYGGVQQAAQTQANSDRSFLLSLLAAGQQAQRMALDQQNIEAARAQSSYQFGAQLDQANQDRALREEMGLMQLDQADEKLAKTQEIAAQKIAAMQDMVKQKALEAHNEKVSQADSIGPEVASRFAELVNKNKDAAEKYQRAQKDALQLDMEMSAMESQNFIRRSKDDKAVFEPGNPSDSAQRATADRINEQFRKKRLALQQAMEDAKKTDQEFKQHMRVILGAGFIPSNDALIYPKTGQVFPIKNSQPVPRRYNPATGTLE